MCGLSGHLLCAQKQGNQCTEQAMGLENGSRSMPCGACQGTVSVHKSNEISAKRMRWGLSGHSECAQKQGKWCTANEVGLVRHL